MEVLLVTFLDPVADKMMKVGFVVLVKISSAEESLRLLTPHRFYLQFCINHRHYYFFFVFIWKFAEKSAQILKPVLLIQFYGLSLIILQWN